MKKTTATLAFLLLGASAVSAGPKNPKPDWVDGSSMEYPREGYLVGVGMGDDRAAAEDRARGEISKILSTVVTVNTSLTESETNAAGGGKTTNAFSQSVSQNVQTASMKALEGVSVVEHWQDDATKVHYALAVLDRAKGALALKDKIAEFDKQAALLEQELGKADGKLPRVKAALKLMTLFKAREELNAELRVLDEAGRTVPNPLNEAELRPKAAKAVAALEVAVDLSGGSSDEIETGLVSGLTRFGLSAKTGAPSGSVNIVVAGKVETKPMQAGEGSRWKWARTTVTVSLKDGSGKIFVRFDASDRQASADYDEAARRSRVALAKKAAAQVHEAVAAYFENQ